MKRNTPSKAMAAEPPEDYATFIKKFTRLWRKELIGYSETIQALEGAIKDFVDGSEVSNIMLIGPSGTGKTTLVANIAQSFPDLNYFYLRSKWMLEKRFGEPESRLKAIIDEASAKQSLIFIDDIHRICGGKQCPPEATRIFDVLTDELLNLRESSARVLVIAATRATGNLDEEIWNYFNERIYFKLPNCEDRLKKLTKIVSEQGAQISTEDLKQIADLAHCYKYRDLDEICRVAKRAGVLDNSSLRKALASYRPEFTKESTSICLPIRWDDIGGHNATKQELIRKVIRPITERERFEMYCLERHTGALLYGPPGNGKTMLVQAAAYESGFRYFYIKGSELSNKYVGETEANVRQLYENARTVAPSIIFFDEIDAFASERGEDRGSSVGNKAVAALLTELNPVDTPAHVFTIAATNKPELVDSALLRAGRLHPAYYIGPPSESDRVEIFKVALRKSPLELGPDETIDTLARRLAQRTELYSGAEIKGVCQAASAIAEVENKETHQTETIRWRHFEQALDKVQARTKKEQLRAYLKFQNNSNQPVNQKDEQPDDSTNHSGHLHIERALVVVQATTDEEQLSAKLKFQNRTNQSTRQPSDQLSERSSFTSRFRRGLRKYIK